MIVLRFYISATQSRKTRISYYTRRLQKMKTAFRNFFNSSEILCVTSGELKNTLYLYRQCAYDAHEDYWCVHPCEKTPYWLFHSEECAVVQNMALFIDVFITYTLLNRIFLFSQWVVEKWWRKMLTGRNTTLISMPYLSQGENGYAVKGFRESIFWRQKRRASNKLLLEM